MAKTEKEYREIEENYNPELEERIRQEQNKKEEVRRQTDDSITFVQVKFGLNFTEDELIAIAEKPHSKLAVMTKKYVYQCVKYAAEKYVKKNVTKA